MVAGRQADSIRHEYHRTLQHLAGSIAERLADSITVSNQRQINIAWSPKGRWIAYNSDYDGNEQWDLFLVSTSNGQVVNLTNTS